MLTVQVPLQKAEKMKLELIKKKLLAKGYSALREGEYLYLPVTEKFSGSAFFDKELKAQKQTLVTLKEALKNKLPLDVLDRVKTAYDQIGSIAILEIDEDLKKYDTIIGETLLSTNTKVATVLAKNSSHEGVFRTQQMRLLAGKDTRVGIHKENGVAIAVDTSGVYFSSRLSTERKRIAELVTLGEKILVMFSGCGPYTCVLGKNTAASLVVGVEINPRGHELALENIKRNKLTCKTYNGDVQKVVPAIVTEHGLFDRILMPLPKSAETFLHIALKVLKPGGIIHFYAFLHEDKISEAHSWIKDACSEAGMTCSIKQTVTCGQQAPHIYRFCVDFTAN